jgi:hypothetical protein
MWNFFGDRFADVWVNLFTHLNDAGETLGALLFISFWSLLFGLAAISIGWVLQAVVAIFRVKRESTIKADTSPKRP